MPLRRRRPQCHQLTTGERDRIIELAELGLLLGTIATRVGHNVSTIQRCVTRWIQEGLRARRRGSGAQRAHQSAQTGIFTSRLFETLFPRHVTSEANCLQEQVDLCSPKPYLIALNTVTCTSNRGTVDHLTQG
ncbi:hypothetical protein TNCV_1826841 [Trichonephila clavipes]|nr:hypothetical protein TNCV_1826841 [Trichonephila clavipes]